MANRYNELLGFLPGSEIPLPQTYSPLNKGRNAFDMVRCMLSRTARMFTYGGLPDTVPQRLLERYLQCCGFCFWTKAPDGELYAFVGGLGGAPSPYYESTLCTIANPALKFSKSCVIGVDGVLGRNDSYMGGLLPLLDRYCSQIAETELTLHRGVIEMRALDKISAPDDNTRKSAEAYLEARESGKPAVIGENAFLDGIKVHSVSIPSNYLTQLVELEQYLRGTMYNEIGLNAPFNMKREALSDGEISQGEDTLVPLLDDMLECRRRMVEEVNEMFGTEITVELSSAWRSRKLMGKLSEDREEAEVDILEAEAVAEVVAVEDGKTDDSQEVNEITDSETVDTRVEEATENAD